MSLTENESKLLELTMQYLQPYGNFDFFEKMKLIENNHYETVTKIYTGTQQLYICDFLVENGFAIRRKDVNPNGTEIQLTDKGRDLKDDGSLPLYLTHVRTLQSDRKRESQRNEYQYWVNVSIAISTGVAAVFYVFGIFDFFEKHHLNWRYVAYFSSGVVSTLLIWLIVKQLSKLSDKSKK